MSDTLRFALLDENAVKPVRKHPDDAGVDVFSLGGGSVLPHSCAVFRTGVTFEVPKGYVFQVWPKSRNNHLIGAGIIDSGYQGETLIKIVNYSDKPVDFYPGDPLAQLVLVAALIEPLQEVSADVIHKEKSERGATGGIVGQ